MQNPSSTLNPQRLYPTSPSSPASNDHFLTTNNEPSPTPRKRYRSHPGCNLCGMLQTIESVYQQKPNTGGLSASASSGTQGIAPPTTTYSYDHASSGNEISRPPTALGQPGSSTQSLPPFSPPLLSSRITSPPPTAHSTYSNEIKIMNDGRKILLHTEAFTVWESPWDKALVGKKSGLGVEAVASGGRHLVIVINKHVESIYDLGPADIPLLSNALSLAHSLLDQRSLINNSSPTSFSNQSSPTSPNPDERSFTGKGKGKEKERGEEVQVERMGDRDGKGNGKGKREERRIGFISGSLADPKHPYPTHIHLHAIQGKFDLASFYRKMMVFGWTNWYEVEDLMAEIRESTSNNRIKSGEPYASPGITENGPFDFGRPILQVPEAGSKYGQTDGLGSIDAVLQDQAQGQGHGQGQGKTEKRSEDMLGLRGTTDERKSNEGRKPSYDHTEETGSSTITTGSDPSHSREQTQSDPGSLSRESLEELRLKHLQEIDEFMQRMEIDKEIERFGLGIRGNGEENADVRRHVGEGLV